MIISKLSNIPKKVIHAQGYFFVTGFKKKNVYAFFDVDFWIENILYDITYNYFCEKAHKEHI